MSLVKTKWCGVGQDNRKTLNMHQQKAIIQAAASVSEKRNKWKYDKNCSSLNGCLSLIPRVSQSPKPPC